MVELLNKAEMIVQKTAKKSLITLTAFEKATVFVMFIGLMVLMLATVYTKSHGAQANAEIEQTQSNIQKMMIENQILQQKIDDMMTYERVTEIAEKYGMTVNINNVRTLIK